jgi:5-methylcytosine-specific restriction endonuclease McrA
MLRTFGDGQVCACTHCGSVLTIEQLEADRIIPGLSYARYNIQPSCRRCNAQRSNDEFWTRVEGAQA